MKFIFTALICLSISQVALAQVTQQAAGAVTQNQNGTKQNNKPLFIIYYRDSIVNKSDSLLATLNLQFIQSVYVLRDKTATDKYGSEANSGAVEIYIKEKNYPEVYQLLKQTSGSIKN